MVVVNLDAIRLQNQSINYGGFFSFFFFFFVRGTDVWTLHKGTRRLCQRNAQHSDANYARQHQRRVQSVQRENQLNPGGRVEALVRQAQRGLGVPHAAGSRHGRAQFCHGFRHRLYQRRLG